MPTFLFFYKKVVMQNFFVKSHGLGNDYIILNQYEISFELTPKAIQKICDVHYGIGSDGILLKVPSYKANFGLRILNPDGSEAEKSGNGLRIFAKYLYDSKFSKEKIFTIETPGGVVRAEITEEVKKKAKTVKVDMGKANFISAEIPVKCANDECIDETLNLEYKDYTINCVSVGNPHCVILKDELDEKGVFPDINIKPIDYEKKNDENCAFGAGNGRNFVCMPA